MTITASVVTRVAAVVFPIEAYARTSRSSHVAAANAALAETYETARDLLEAAGGDRETFTFPEHHEAGEWRIYADRPATGDRIFVSAYPNPTR